MKEVNIYIRTSLTGPCIKDGRWAAAMECQTSKGPAVKGICGEEQETTYYRLVTAWNCEILENTKCAVQCDPVYGLYFYQEHDRKREAGAVEAGGMEKTVRGRGEEPGIVAAVSDVVRAA